ncbi:MAG: helix-turn-helix domain-containing protein [Oricola sp.]|nr:helix-turn-helix domain-containing protein [Oricola sp.]
MDQFNLTIGKLSDQTGVNIETIRYYEKIGLMPAPPRTQSGRRLYDGALADRLCFIRRGRELGFSLDDIRALLGLEDRKPTCAEVFETTSTHVEMIRTKISDLKKLERTLSTVAKGCSRNRTRDCAIIKTLFS